MTDLRAILISAGILCALVFGVATAKAALRSSKTEAVCNLIAMVLGIVVAFIAGRA